MKFNSFTIKLHRFSPKKTETLIFYIKDKYFPIQIQFLETKIVYIFSVKILSFAFSFVLSFQIANFQNPIKKYFLQKISMGKLHFHALISSFSLLINRRG